MIVVSSLYASLNGLIYVALSINVIRKRWKFKQSLGDGGESILRKAIRVHGNFSEYVPLALVLLGFLELNQVQTIWLHIIGSSLTIGRILHAFGLSFFRGSSFPRFAGMSLTFGVLIFSSLLLLKKGLSL